MIQELVLVTMSTIVALSVFVLIFYQKRLFERIVLVFMFCIALLVQIYAVGTLIKDFYNGLLKQEYNYEVNEDVYK